MNTNKKIGIILISIFLLMPIMIVQAENDPVGTNFCNDVMPTMRFIGYLLLITRTVLPVILIIMGSVDFLKAVTGKDDDLQKQAITFSKRILAGILIFFLPAILNVTFNFINDWTNVASEYEICANCLFRPGTCQVN